MSRVTEANLAHCSVSSMNMHEACNDGKSWPVLENMKIDAAQGGSAS